MYASSYFLWTEIIFPSIIARGINDLYFFYINLLEFATLFLVRTRSSIKYLPKFVTILNIIFIMYINSYMYPAQYELMSVVNNITITLFAYFLKYYEIPAVAGDWNPFGTYTPSFNNPRAGYHFVSNDSFMLGFDIFTMFQSLRFRERFTLDEQRTYDLVSQQEILGYDFYPTVRQ